MNKKQLVELAQQGGFVHTPEYKCFADLDGTHARQFLESKGFNVIENKDTGYNGLAITDCGVYLSTNGHISQR